jgi:hypothetical protein
VLSSTGYDTTWGVGLDAEFGVSRYASLAVSAVLPLTTAEFGSGAFGTAGARTTTFGLGFEVPLAPPDSVLIPKLGAGTGLVWMHTMALSTPSTTTSLSQDFVTAQFYADAALSLRVYGPARLVLAGTIAGTTEQIAIRVDDGQVGTFGWPIGMMQLRLEAQL